MRKVCVCLTRERMKKGRKKKRNYKKVGEDKIPQERDPRYQQEPSVSLSRFSWEHSVDVCMVALRNLQPHRSSKPRTIYQEPHPSTLRLVFLGLSITVYKPLPKTSLYIQTQP